MGSTLILCYLSEVVVLKLASAVLYLECRPLDMRTGAPEWDTRRDFLGLWVQFCRGLWVRGLERTADKTTWP